MDFSGDYITQTQYLLVRELGLGWTMAIGSGAAGGMIGVTLRNIPDGLLRRICRYVETLGQLQVGAGGRLSFVRGL